MTPQEAIETIKIAIAEVEWNYPMNYAVAFEKAIEALEKMTKPKERVYEIHTQHCSKKVKADEILCAPEESLVIFFLGGEIVAVWNLKHIEGFFISEERSK